MNCGTGGLCLRRHPGRARSPERAGLQIDQGERLAFSRTATESDPCLHIETLPTLLPRQRRHPVADPVGYGNHDHGNQKVLADDLPGPLTL